jgi:hypothetical protein
VLCSPVEVNRRFGGIYHLNLQGLNVRQSINQHESGSKQRQLLPVSCWFLVWLILMAETSVDYHRSTWHYIPEDRTLRSHRCESLKSHMTQMRANISYLFLRVYYIIWSGIVLPWSGEDKYTSEDRCLWLRLSMRKSHMSLSLLLSSKHLAWSTTVP